MGNIKSRFVSLFIIGIIFIFSVIPVYAATFTVNSNADTDDGTCNVANCTLREAINAANAAPGADIIDFNLPAGNETITLGSSLPFVLGSIIMNGDNAAGSGVDVRVSGNNSVFIMDIRASSTILNITLADGNGQGGAFTVGGAIIVDVNNVTFDSNRSPGSAGAIAVIGGTLNVQNSTFVNNQATNSGGAIFNQGTTTIVNSTFAGNSASQGSAVVSNSGPVNISNTTIANNNTTTGGGAIRVSGGSLTIKNVILSNNLNGGVSPGNCLINLAGVTFTARGTNLVSDNTCTGAVDVGAANIVQVTTAQLNLGMLANNGGRTQTMTLNPGSVAINMATDCTVIGGGAVGTDQRGTPRPQGGVCDVGAFEATGIFRTLTITANGAGSGTVTDPTGLLINCTITAGVTSGDCSESVLDGTVITFTATASGGSAFGTWTGCDSAVTNVCTQTVLGGNEIVNVAFGVPPTFSKAFLPDPIVLNGTSTLTFTIDNTANIVADTSLNFTDNLPAGLVVATPPNASTTCTGGTITAVATSGVISYTGGTVSAGASCIITVDVTSATAATYVNTTGDLTSAFGNSGTASDTLVVVPAPTFTKSFLPDPIVITGTSTLTLTIDNTGSTLAATNLDFTDNLPAGLVIATPANASTTCTGGTLTATSGAGVISYTGGTASASASCTVTVDVTSATAAIYVNTTGDLTSSSGNSGAANDTLTVADELAIGKSFTNDPILTTGGTVTLEFTILNPDMNNAVSAIAFTDDLTAVLTGLIAISENSNTCGGTVTLGTIISFAGGSLAANSSCTISLSLTVVAGSVAGTYANTTSAITGTVGMLTINGNVATDSLIIQNVPPPPVASNPNQTENIILFDPAISKLGFLLPGQVGVTGEQVEWIVTVSNLSGVAGQNVVITDNIDPRLQINLVDAPNATVIINGQTVTVTYGILNPNETVQFSIFTTVLAGVEVDNTACVAADNQGAEECATGKAIGQLPNTGESPFWRNGLLILLALSLTLIPIVWLVSRVKSPQATQSSHQNRRF